MFLRNAWYVAARDKDVGAGLVPVTILGDAIVMHRKLDGSVVALEDACPHRKLSLSMGRLKGEQVECGYHGLTFDGSGVCVHVPGTERIPPSARVRAYPVERRYGLLWIWMGDAAKADPATIFRVEHWGDPAWGVNQGDEMTVDCNYLYVTDNLLDPSHMSWVHRGSFAGAACEDTPLEVSAAANGVTVSRWMHDVEPAPLYAPYLKFAGNCDRKQQYEVRFPSHAAIEAIFTPAGSGGEGRPAHPDVYVMGSYNLMKPIDANTTRYYRFQMRNFAPGDAKVSSQFAESVRAAFEEDRAILADVHKGMAEKRTPNIDLRVDTGPLRFRRRLAQLIEAEGQTFSVAA
jgi:vanillate O-demethylase monooxygenase subunit